ncbi:MAG: hypothetical protein EHM59_06780 [Betaproteobacteria bacterium]|nr:MAG: hypothetical protein EHM59_06780 [Betaproteobacteria bacterium]
MIAGRLLGVSLCCLAAFPAYAAQPAVPIAPAAQAIAPAAVQTDGSQALGRFFFTPGQRAALDEARRRPTAARADTAQKAPLPPAPDYVTLNGVVRRSDGTTTVWLNNKPVRSGQTEEGLQVAPSTRAAGAGSAVTVRVPQTGTIVNLKVGQQVDVTSGKVEEGYRSARRAQVATEAPARAPDSPGERSQRRASRDRELLRDLLREIDGAPSSGADAASDPPPAAP